jgi:hypothetical protein
VYGHPFAIDQERAKFASWRSNAWTSNCHIDVTAAKQNSAARKEDLNMINYLKALAFVAVAGMFAQSGAQADVWDKKTVVTINEPMQIPNMTLQPGTYVVRLSDVGAGANRHIVQFFNKDETSIVTTVLGIPNERLRPTGKSVFAFWETPAGQPKALRAWFYPGDNFGQEFAYPKEEAARITANNKGADVPVSEEKAPRPSAPATPSKEASVTSDSAVQQSPAQASPEPNPAPVAAAGAPQQIAPSAPPSTTTTRTDDAQRLNPPTTPDKLPQTASNLPLIGLIGMLSLICAFALNLAYRRGHTS